MIVAVDGPVAAGKGTLARRLAAHFDYAYLDTGLLYRATALRLLRAGADRGDVGQAAAAARAIDGDDLANPGLRAEAVGIAASQISQIAEVRAALLAHQRKFAAEPPGGRPGAVLDGRDIGTVVCPEAEIKLFVTASAETRAHRRYLELWNSDPEISEAEVRADLDRRDSRDSSRSRSPLRPAHDAHLLDTTIY